MAEKAIKVELSEEDRKILLAQKKALSDILKPEKKSKGIGAMAAEMILSGEKSSVIGALGSATKQKATESLQNKTEQLKDKFDPLNIIHSMFGGGGFGSVMTAAIGKSMGRDEDDVRKFARLDPAEDRPDDGTPSQMPSGEGGEKSNTMLSEMLKYVIKISEDIRGLKDSSKNQEGLFKDQIELDGKQLNLEEKQLDAANEAKYEAEFAKKKPTPVGEDGKDKKETKEEKGFLSSLLGFASALRMIVSGPFKAFAAILGFALSPLRALGKLLGGPLLRGLAAVGAAALPAARAIGAKALEYGGKAVTAATPYVKAAGAKALEYGGKALEVGKSVGRSALSYAAEKAPQLVEGAKAFGSKALDVGKNIGAKVAEKAPGIIEGVKTMGGKALEGAKSLGGKALESVGLKAAAPKPGFLTAFGEVGAKRAAAAGAETAGKEGIAALIKKAIAKRVPKAVGSALGKSVPFLGAAIGVGFALSRLMDGDVVGAGLEAVSGIGSFATAIPATIALVAKDIYQDVYGVKPESDPQFGERIGLIQSETEAAVKAEFAGKVGEEEKKGGDKKEGDKKEGDKKGNAPEETKVPEAPELKGDTKQQAQRKSAEDTESSMKRNMITDRINAAGENANDPDVLAAAEESLKPGSEDFETGLKNRRKTKTDGGFKPKSAPSQVSNLMDGGGDAVEPLPEESSGTGEDLDAEWNTDNYPTMFYSSFKFGQEDPENAKKYNIYQRTLSEEYALKRAKSYGRDKPNQDDYDTTGVKAYKDSLLKFRKELTASGAALFGDAPAAEAAPATSPSPPPVEAQSTPPQESSSQAAPTPFAYSATPEEDNNDYAAPVEPAPVEPLPADAFETGKLAIKGMVNSAVDMDKGALAPTQEKGERTDFQISTPQGTLIFPDQATFEMWKQKPQNVSFTEIPQGKYAQIIEDLGSTKEEKFNESFQISTPQGTLIFPDQATYKEWQTNTQNVGFTQGPEGKYAKTFESAELTPARPTTGEKMMTQSNENTMAKTEAMTGGNNTNTSIVSAPKVTNATNVTNAPINVRNSENTFVRNQDRVHYF